MLSRIYLFFNTPISNFKISLLYLSVLSHNLSQNLLKDNLLFSKFLNNRESRIRTEGFWQILALGVHF
jgi:hypothetical protein